MDLSIILFLFWFLYLYSTTEKQLYEAISKQKFNRPAAITTFVSSYIKRSLKYDLIFCIVLSLIPIISNPKILTDMFHQTFNLVEPSLSEKATTTHNPDSLRMMMQSNSIYFSVLKIFQLISMFVIIQTVISSVMCFSLGFNQLKEEGFVRLRLINYIKILLQKNTIENHEKTYKKLEQFR